MVLQVPTVNPRLASITAPQLPRIDVLGAIGSGLKMSDRSRELRAQEQLQSTLQDQGPAALGGDVDALNEIRMLGEDGFNMASQIQQVLDSQDSKKVLEAQKKIEKHGLFLASILKLEPPEQKRKLFDESHKLMSAGDRKAATEFLHISQLKDDLDIQGEVESALVIASAGNKYLQGFVPQTGARTGLASAKTEIFKNGSTIQGLPSGQVDVRNPKGNLVLGDERVRVLEAAQQSGIVGAADKASAIKKAERKVLASTAGDVISSEKSAIRGQESIDTAFETGEGIPVLNRALDLLGSVKTGGFEQAKLRAAQTFGIEGADEGELSNLLGKAVLSQLRQTFGAAFTASEGEGLARIEAGFGKNPESNKRLLENALATTRRSVKRGIRAAKRAGQDEEAADLQELLDATLETPATQESLPQGITEDDIIETMSANNMTREEVLQRLNQ
jgi:hypothetical protein